MEQCPKCNHKYAKKPLKDENGKWIWKNFFYVDIQTIIVLISIIMILFGTSQMINQRKEIFSAPCDWCTEMKCGINIMSQNNTENYDLQIQLNNLKPIPTE